MQLKGLTFVIGAGTILSTAVGPNTVTGKPLASLIVTLLGSLVTVTVTLCTSVVFALQPVTVCPVSSITAVPGWGGFAVTLAVKVDLVHLRLIGWATPTCVNVSTVLAFSPA